MGSTSMDTTFRQAYDDTVSALSPGLEAAKSTLDPYVTRALSSVQEMIQSATGPPPSPSGKTSLNPRCTGLLRADEAPPPPASPIGGEIRRRRNNKPPTGKFDEDRFFRHVAAHEKTYIDRLAEFVAIPSVSADPGKRHEVRRAMNWAKAWCDRLGGATRLEELGGMVSPLPPALLAQFGNDPAKRTLVVYGHLDVQPAKQEDGWDTDPFELTEKNGALYGRGATDDKGPVTAWLWALEAYQANDWELPVNLRFLFEGMEEAGSIGLPELCKRLGKPGEFLDPAAVDFVCVSDNYWSGKTQPCLSFGLRGIAYYFLEVQCSTKDLHSGAFGGAVHEALVDCMHIMSSMVDTSGKILIEGILDDVPGMTQQERDNIDAIEFDVEDFKVDAGIRGVSDKFAHDTKEDILAHRWRWPSLSIHGVEGAFDEPGSKTVIPSKVIGKFSLRLVPNMTPDQVTELVTKHIERKVEAMGTPNRVKLELQGAGMPWLRDPEADPNFRAAAEATKRVHGVPPGFNREGGSIPPTQILEEVTDATCVLFPLGRSDDGAHSQNEKLDVDNYMKGIKVLGCYIEELASLPLEPDAAARAAAAAAAADRKATNKWRQECKTELLRYGCDCLECQVP